MLFTALYKNSHTDTQTLRAVDAVQGIVAAFRQHPVVMIGESHGLQQAGDFYIRLVRDPAFQETVQDIVIEFGSSNNQQLLDRYISGEDVPLQELRHIWRDTTKVASWESPIYAQWLAAICEVNKGLQPGRRLHVIAADTPVDWSRIQTHADWAALGDNNVSFADVIVNEVLAKKHHALVVLGSGHLVKSGDRRNVGGQNTTTRVEYRYPGSTYIAFLFTHGMVDRDTENRLRLSAGKAPALVDFAAAGLDKANDKDGVPLIKKADALLYLCPPREFVSAEPPAGSLDAAYMKEVDRRSMIEWGELRARNFLGSAAAAQ